MGTVPPTGGAAGPVAVGATTEVKEIIAGRRAMDVLNRCLLLITDLRDGLQETAVVLANLQKLPIDMQKLYTEAASKFMPLTNIDTATTGEQAQMRAATFSSLNQKFTAVSDMMKNQGGIWKEIGGGISQILDTVMTTSKSFIDAFSRFLEMMSQLMSSIAK